MVRDSKDMEIELLKKELLHLKTSQQPTVVIQRPQVIERTVVRTKEVEKDNSGGLLLGGIIGFCLGEFF